MKNLTFVTRIFVCTVALSSFGLMTSCSRRSTGEVPVPEVPSIESAQMDQPETNVPVSVGRLHDGRAVLGEQNESSATKAVFPAGDVATAVERGLERSLTKKGLVVTQEAPVVISGEIVKWSADITPGINKDVVAKAELYVEAIDPKGEKLFSGNFAGEQALKQPIVTDEDVNETLGLAMREAVAQFVNDRDFLKTLWRDAEREHIGRMPRTPPIIR